MSITGERVLLKSPINGGTGYGRDGILLTQHLMKMNADLHLEPKYISIPLPEDILPLFAKQRPAEKHFDLAINHEYPGELGWPLHMPRYVDKIVGWTMYEFTSFGDENEMTEQLAERLSIFDLVLVYDEVSYQALSEYVPEEDRDRLRILQGGYDSAFWKPSEEESQIRDWDGTFIFGMNGTMNARKNPWAAINGFKMLKDEHGDDFDAELHLKTTSMVFPPVLEQWCPGLKIHYENWSMADLRNFYFKLNCLLAPSWGEGKNLPALEAQTSGCPVIATAFGGHMQWADEQWSYLVTGPMEEHAPRVGSMRISPETMAEKMWHVYNNRNEAMAKGQMAAQMIPAQCDWEPVLYRLKSMLNTVKPRDRSSFS